MVLQRMERHLHVSCSSDCDTARHLKDTDLWWLCSSLTQGYANRAASLCFQASGLIGRRGSSSCFGIGESPCQEQCDQFCVPQFKKDILWICPEKGNKAGDKARRHVLWEVAEDSEFVCFGEKWDQGWPHCSLLVPVEGKRRGRCWSLFPVVFRDRTCENDSRLQSGGSDRTQEAVLYWEGVQAPEQSPLGDGDCPKPCQCLRGIWTLPLRTCFNWWSGLNWSCTWSAWSLYGPSNRNTLFYSDYSRVKRWRFLPWWE